MATMHGYSPMPPITLKATLTPTPLLSHPFHLPPSALTSPNLTYSPSQGYLCFIKGRGSIHPRRGLLIFPFLALETPGAGFLSELAATLEEVWEGRKAIRNQAQKGSPRLSVLDPSCTVFLKSGLWWCHLHTVKSIHLKNIILWVSTNAYSHVTTTRFKIQNGGIIPPNSPVFFAVTPCPQPQPLKPLFSFFIPIVSLFQNTVSVESYDMYPPGSGFFQWAQATRDLSVLLQVPTLGFHPWIASIHDMVRNCLPSHSANPRMFGSFPALSHYE